MGRQEHAPTLEERCPYPSPVRGGVDQGALQAEPQTGNGTVLPDNLDNALLPEFGAYPIDQIPRDEIKAFAHKLMARRHGKTEKNPQGVPYSKATAHSVIRTLSALMGCASRRQNHNQSGASASGSSSKMEKTDLTLLTHDEGEVLFASTLEYYPADHPLIFTLYRTGMRKERSGASSGATSTGG